MRPLAPLAFVALSSLALGAAPASAARSGAASAWAATQLVKVPAVARRFERVAREASTRQLGRWAQVGLLRPTAIPHAALAALPAAASLSVGRGTMTGAVTIEGVPIQREGSNFTPWGGERATVTVAITGVELSLKNVARAFSRDANERRRIPVAVGDARPMLR